MTAKAAAGAPDRLLAVDLMRGLVILVLVPDLGGGFSFHLMAERFPDSAFWTALGWHFSHARWTGPRLWDFVMPAFVFLVGVGIHLSFVARCARGQSYSSVLGNAVTRASALVLIGLLLGFPVKTWADELWPYAIIGVAFPLSEVLSRWGVAKERVARFAAVQSAASVVVLGVAAVWVAARIGLSGNYDLNNILVQIGLAYLPAFALVRLSATRQVVSAVAILAAYAAAFIAYTPPADAVATSEVFHGLASHWNNGSNVAAAFDLWLLNQLPRSSPYVGNALGAHTLQFVALIPTMIGGMLSARVLAGDGTTDPASKWAPLALAGTASIAAGLMLSDGLIPIVKWLWTPSWVLLSLGVCMIWLAPLSALSMRSNHRSVLIPLVALGSNSILLYTIAAHDRWRIVGFWRHALGEHLTAADAAPVIEACLVLFTLGLLAYALFRARIFFRL